VITSDTYRLECPPRRPIDDRVAFAVWADGDEDPRLNVVAPLKGLPRERIVVPARQTIIGPLVPDVWFVARLDPNAIASARCGPHTGVRHVAPPR
jgi:hypothetical protein